MPTTMNADASSYRQCQSLLKGLELLSLLNQFPNGTASISELAQRSGQHRTTVKRLLETLKLAGYVSHDIATNLYRITFLVQRLSYGYRDTTQIAELAWPLMRSLSKQVVWPCTLVAPEGCEMVVRYSTRAYSPLSFHPGMPGRKMPMLTTAAGRAYFAYASDAARATLLSMLRSDAAASSHPLMSDAAIDQLLRQVRGCGYASNLGEWSVEPKFSAYAAPISHQGEAIVCLNVVFLSSALDNQPKREELARQLLDTAQSIERLYAEKLQQWPALALN